MKLFFTLVTLVLTVAIHAAGYIDSVPPLKPSPRTIADKQNPATKPVAIRITCGRTNYFAEPLLIIDGIVFECKKLRDFSADDIASINILKDAAATALYGWRAAEGVIVITTKSTLNRKFIIKDLLNGEKIPAATIIFRSNKDTVKAVAGDDGVLITVKLKRGVEYAMTISSPGYKTFSTLVQGKEQVIWLERNLKECSIKPLYPNPVQRNTIFNLELENEQDEIMQLAIISVNGSVISLQSKKISKGLNHISITADAKWAAGIYNIQVRNEKGSLVRQEKLIVQ